MIVSGVIAGVGGQGAVLMARALALAAMESGLEVRTAETKGMAQRGGSVISQVRFGHGLFGALIPDRQADFVLGLELAETVRAVPKLRPGGLLIANRTPVIPPMVSLGRSRYNQEEIIDYLVQREARVVLLDASRIAREAGSYRAANLVLLGALAGSGRLPFAGELLLEVALDLLPPRWRECNRIAFAQGFQTLEVIRECEPDPGRQAFG